MKRSIEEGLTVDDMELLQKVGKKYSRLVKEFGVQPSEAARSILNEISRDGTLISPFLQDAIYNYLRTLKI